VSHMGRQTIPLKWSSIGESPASSCLFRNSRDSKEACIRDQASVSTYWYEWGRWQDLNYQSKRLPRSQGVCNFKEWSYEVYLEGCPSRPVTKSCDCIKCKTDNSNCDRISMATPSCVVNPLET
uniref:Glycoprotein hormone subunit beta domain-containing protein n=1 Tax=Salmo trutta TaxID=8032 RepID=A0A673XXM3_SALTR